MSKHSLKDFIIETVDPREYYKKRFPRWNDRTKNNVSCVFHSPDRKPSLSINLTNGGAKCFASSCQKSIGNIVHFESQLHHISESKAALNLYEEFVRPIVPNQVVETYYRTLSTDERIKSAFIRATGINAANIEAFRIGYSIRAKRYTIPILDRFGNVINIRFYRLKSQRRASDVKIYSLVEGKNTEHEIRYGGGEIFSWPHFNFYSSDKPLFIMASEKETILAIQHGLQAMCSTTGEGTLPESILDYLKEFDIATVFDQDKGGQTGAERIKNILQRCKSVTVLTLPFPPDYKGDRDFDDWINSKVGNVFSLLNLYRNQKNTTSHPSSLETENEKTDNESLPVVASMADGSIHTLAEIRTNVSLLNKSVKTRGIIAAVSSKSFDVPWKFQVKTKSPGYVTQSFGIGRELVSFVGASDSSICDTIAERVGTKVREWKPLDFISISEVEVVPLTEVSSDEEGRYTTQRCFLVGIIVDSNTPYEFTTVPTTLKNSQEKILIIYNAVEVSRAIDTWKFSSKDTKEFDTFRPDQNETPDEKLSKLAEELSVNHTKIYSRADLHLVCLLTWFSPIGWYFPNESMLQRGWVNSLAIGDTQTGKSQVVTTLQKLIKMGDIISAENCTFVGLVGGAIKKGSGQLMLTWGRLPLCDRKLVVLEELSGLSVQEISNMSDVRSRGIAKLDKGGLSSQTPARTRLIALSNVRPMLKNLGQYLSGVKAIQELIGHPEDVSRFDLIVTLIDNEVQSQVINNPRDETIEATFTPNQLQRLCQFAWALKPNQIRFSDDSYLACLGWTERLQKIYHPSVPIFKAASGRLLLARIAASIATLQFNWDGEVIAVEESHVEAAVNFLRSLYDKPSFGYLDYSKQAWDRERVKEEAELKKSINGLVKPKLLRIVFSSLIHSARFTRDELQATASIQPYQADDLIGTMFRSGVLRKGEANTWEITPAGKAWMERQIK